MYVFVSQVSFEVYHEVVHLPLHKLNNATAAIYTYTCNWGAFNWFIIKSHLPTTLSSFSQISLQYTNPLTEVWSRPTLSRCRRLHTPLPCRARGTRKLRQDTDGIWRQSRSTHKGKENSDRKQYRRSVLTTRPILGNREPTRYVPTQTHLNMQKPLGLMN